MRWAAPPGGAADVVGRLIAEAFSERLGARHIVENRAGAGGTIAAEAAARAAPDGATLFIGIVSTQVLVPLIRRVPYDAERDFAPVGMISQAPMVLLVNPALPVRTPRELVDYARTRQGGVNVSNGGVATLPHLLHEMFARRSGLAGTAVPYSGSA
ncbi:MAG: tripartite tricarboxylate transporter substrate-binding protein, partial [Alphaproteobacteria bacterium]|nr:tripartite tricarboxylate transporter substrate-binding protein [Alphaproteobacteria bacterium]